MHDLTQAEYERVQELIREHGIELPDGSLIMRSSWDFDASEEDHALMDRASALVKEEQAVEAFSPDRPMRLVVASNVLLDAQALGAKVAPLREASKRRWDALAALILTPHIRDYLMRTDPQALQQARLALGLSEEVE
jgi:hypothetical protein